MMTDWCWWWSSKFIYFDLVGDDVGGGEGLWR